MTLTIHIKPDQIEVLPEAMKVGGVTKRASSYVYIIPPTYTVENFGFINFEQLNPMGELWKILTQQIKGRYSLKSMYALVITWKQQRRLDTKTRIHFVTRPVSSAESVRLKHLLNDVVMSV